MTLDEIVGKLGPIDGRLREELGVTGLFVFGSVARGEAVATSDVDVLVDFAAPPTYAGFMDLKFCLEDLLGVPVDLVTRRALRPSMKTAVEAEAIRVA